MECENCLEIANEKLNTHLLCKTSEPSFLLHLIVRVDYD